MDSLLGIINSVDIIRSVIYSQRTTRNMPIIKYPFIYTPDSALCVVLF